MALVVLATKTRPQPFPKEVRFAQQEHVCAGIQRSLQSGRAGARRTDHEQHSTLVLGGRQPRQRRHRGRARRTEHAVRAADQLPRIQAALHPGQLGIDRIQYGARIGFDEGVDRLAQNRIQPVELGHHLAQFRRKAAAGA